MENNEAVKAERFIWPIAAVDRVAAPVALVLGILFMYFSPGALSLSIYLLTLTALTALYFRLKGVKQNIKTLPFLCAALLTALYFTFYDGEVYVAAARLLFILLYGLRVCATAGASVAGSISAYAPFDMLNIYVVRPVLNAGGFFAASRRRDGRGAFIPVLAGVGLALPAAIGVAALLRKADAAFGAVVERMLESIAVRPIDLIFRHFAGIIVGVYIFARSYGALSKKGSAINKEGADRFSQTMKFLPPVTVFILLGAVSAIYVAYLLSQSVYFFSAFRTILPEGFSYAEYARRGFFELCGVAAINAALIFISRALMRESGSRRALRIFSVGISLFTQLIIATALSKLVMYVNNYGLTRRRVNAAWFMALLFVVFAFIIVKSIKDNIKIGGAIFALCMGGFMLLAASDPDAWITSYNIARYESGVHTSLDCEYILCELSSSAAVRLCEYEGGQSERAQKLGGGMKALSAARYEPEDWRSYSLPRARAYDLAVRYRERTADERVETMSRRAAEYEQGDVMRLRELTDFEWDTVVVTTYEDYKYVDGLGDFVKVCFIKDNEPVLTINEYAENIGFSLISYAYDGGMVWSYEDDPSAETEWYGEGAKIFVLR